ncbi:MAG: hypothetical protein AAGE59_27330 [Cyanobacteria bacterium P01_F01_bin.86]
MLSAIENLATTTAPVGRVDPVVVKDDHTFTRRLTLELTDFYSAALRKNPVQ